MTPSPTKSCPSCGERYDADVLFCPQDGTPLTSHRGSQISQQELLFEERDEAADELDEAALREALDTEPSAGEPEVKDGD